MHEQQLGKYTVVRRLGAGGMADVFLCRLHGPGGFEKEVVIKRIRADIGHDADFVTMFFDEARLAANLNHCNVVQVYEVGQLDGAPYLAMEYAKGPTLASVLHRTRRHKQRVDHALLASVFAGISAGLAYAHAATDADGRPLNIVHRDVSPQNIIISLDGTPKLFDFGLAKARGSLARSVSERVKGKFAYMAPEQARGEEVDARADIFALGVCLFEAAVGRRPFQGQTEAELLAARLEGRCRRPSELIEGFPTALEHIILAMMWPEPAGRPTAAEVRERLVQFAAGSRHPCDAPAIAAWLTRLFPDEGHDLHEPHPHDHLTPIPRSEVAAPPAGAGASKISAAPLGRGRRRWWLGGAAVAALAAGLVIARPWAGSGADASAPAEPPVAASAPVAVSVEPAAVPPPVVQPAPAPPVAGAPSASTTSATLTLLDDAERALADGDTELATRLVAASVALAVDDPAVATRRRVLAETLARTEEPRRRPDRDGDRPAPGSRLASAPLPGAVVSAPAPAAAPAPAPPAPVAAPAAPPPAAAAPPPTTPSVAAASSPPPAPVAPALAAAPPAPSVAEVRAPASTVAPAPAASVGTLDAIPASTVSVDGSLTPSEVKGALARVHGTYRDCYRAAARRAQRTPPLTLAVSFTIDEQRAVRDVRVPDDALGLAPCIRSATAQIRPRTAPDVGTVAVRAVITFAPTR